MAFYDWFFDLAGLRDWCESGGGQKVMSMDELLGRIGKEQKGGEVFPFPSFDKLHEACPEIAQTRDLTNSLETLFLDLKDGLKLVLDPLTQPLSWMLDGSLFVFTVVPWWVMIPVLVGLTFWISRSKAVSMLVAVVFLLLALIDHYVYAIQTLSIVFVCTFICALLGVPIGIAMSKNRMLRRALLPVLDLLQTLPSFVYLIPLIFLFSATESKLYGIAIILYAIVPIIRLTDLGIRLVDKSVVEAASAYGMNARQKLVEVELPLALPNIMAGLNQTIMMSLAMVVIASLVSAPGLGVLVLRGIRNLELGVGLVAGLGIVLLAVLLDRVSKAALERVQAGMREAEK